MTREPTRWAAAALPEELAAALRSASADAPDAAIDRLRARLDGALGPAFAASEPDVGARVNVVLGAQQFARSKWLGLCAVVAVGVGILLLGKSSPEPSSAVRSHAAASLQAPTAASSQEPELPAQAPPPDGLQPVAAVAEPQPTAARPIKHNSTVRGLAEELRQLKQIRQHVASAPARAIAEADAHARRFPEGTLGPERELLRIDALLRLGRNVEAQKLAARELAAPGGTPYRARIEKLLTAHAAQ